MQELVDDFVTMTMSGLILDLCEKYYDENVVMFNNGAVFAESMREAYDKQKGFVGSVKEFDVKLLSSNVEGNVSDLTFHYKMTGCDSKVNDFTGRHIQTWKNRKIVKEEFFSVA